MRYKGGIFFSQDFSFYLRRGASKVFIFDECVRLENTEPQEHQPLARDTWYGSSYKDSDFSSKLSEPQEEMKPKLQPISIHSERNVIMGKKLFFSEHHSTTTN